MPAAAHETQKEFFNGLSEKYDGFLAQMDANNQIGGAVLELIDARPHQTMLDIGIGTGYYSAMIAREAGEGFRIVGVDVSNGMLAKARERFENLGLADRVELNNINVESYSFDQTFDRAFTSSAMRYFADQKAVVQKVYDALVEGGRLVIQEIRLPDSEDSFQHKMVTAFYPGLISKPTMQSHMEHAGFKNIESIDIDMTPSSKVDIDSMREHMESTLDEETKERIAGIFREAQQSGQLARERQSGIVFCSYMMVGEK